MDDNAAALATATAEAAKAFAAMDGEPLETAPPAIATLAQPPPPPPSPIVAAAAADAVADEQAARSILPDILRAAAGAFLHPARPTLAQPATLAPAPPAPPDEPLPLGVVAAIAAGLLAIVYLITKD